MAVAAVAVAMGPRNRRRLSKGGIVVGVVAALVAAVLLTRSPDHSGPASSVRSSHANSSVSNLVFGMTPKQVRSLAGHPTTTRGNCWLYPVKGAMVGSVSLAPFNPDAVKLCFYSGTLSQIIEHRYVSLKHRFLWLPWVTIEPSSQPQQ